jgi:hypothetical protein
MNGPKPALLTPVLVGGLAAGVLSGLPFLNCLCCLWIILGAVLTVFLAARDSRQAFTAGDGAMAGAFTGVVAAFAEALISIPLASINVAFMRKFMERMAEYVQEMPEGWERWFERGTGSFSPGWFFINLIATAAIFAVLGALGGVIGASLFGRKPAPPAAPPSSPAGAPPAPTDGAPR